VSSAYNLILEETQSAISFMYDTNNIGPWMVPSEVPDTTGAHSEKVPLRTTRCLRQVRKCLSQLSRFPLRPRLRSLISRRSWGTLSKALARSKKMALVAQVEFLDFAKSWIVESN